MKNADGKSMVRLGDRTDHGGVVMEAAPDLMHMGIAVALHGHKVMCPQCKGPFPIIATGDRTHKGIPVAYEGDETACGAKLIAS